MLKLIGTSRNCELWLPPSATALRRHFLTTSNGQCVEEALRVVRKPKTQSQLGAIFGLVLATIVRVFNERGWDTSILLRVPEPTGDPIDEDILRAYLYGVRPMLDDEGRHIHLSDDNCDTKAASDWLDKVMNYAATEWHIYVPSPDPNWRQK